MKVYKMLDETGIKHKTYVFISRKQVESMYEKIKAKEDVLGFKYGLGNFGDE